MLQKYYLFLIFLFLIFLKNPTYAKNKMVYKYSLSMYHYNVQYVAGDKKAEEKIITESFEPVVDMYLRHPNWGGDFEMQGYMLELMSEKFPQVLKKFKKIVNRGQVDLVCFHYADQLFLAFPKLDMEWSEKLLGKIFQKIGIKRSNVVFTQEGQFGEGMFYFMQEHHFDIATYPHNLYEYFHKEEETANAYPLYSHKSGVDIILHGKSVNYENKKFTLQMNWSKSGDAEFVATGKNPYAGNSFKYNPKILKEYEDSLISLEKQGTKIITVSNYVKKLKKLNIQPKKLKPILDGTWQPEDTENLWLWMGKHRTNLEKDIQIRSINFYLRNDLTAAETLINFAKAKKINCSEEEKMLEDGWKHQLLSEVSDSTGWVPFPIEIKYSLDESLKVKSLVAKIFSALKEKLNYKFVEINTFSQQVKQLKEIPKETEYGHCPKWITKIFINSVEQSGNTSINYYCAPINKYRTDMKIINFIFKTGSYAHFNFPLKNNKILYSSALAETQTVKYDLNKFNFPLAMQYTYLGCPNGLIGLDKNLFLIKHNAYNNVGIRIDKAKKIIGIDMENIPEKSEWLISLVKGKRKIALQQALKINILPTIIK